MTLKNTLDNLALNRKKNTAVYCAYQMLYNSLSKEDAKALDNAWEMGYSTNIILLALRSEGHKSSNESLRAHKNKVCRCPQT